MRIWRFDSKSTDLGAIETKRCDTCAEDRSFKLFLYQRYARISYLYSWMWQKKYLLLCDVCRRGAELDWRKVETKPHTRAILFHRRHGWPFLSAVIAIVVVLILGNDRCHADNRSMDGSYADDVYVA